MRTIRVGNCSGFYGDRLSAAREMLEGGRLDYLSGDWLAELTMLILARDQRRDSSLGYARTFVTQMTDCMALAKDQGVKVVSNAGGLNPGALAEKLRQVAAEQGLDVTVAHIEGDNLLPRAAEFGFDGALTANAYLGAFGIAAALQAGADVVVSGRVTDASVVMGPAIAEFGWGREDHDRLAGALVAGHVIECGMQATGGNFSGFRTIDTTKPLGFPIAEIADDGSCVITKHPGTGGAVTLDTVTAQLLYEIQGPVYLNPDVAAELDTIELEPAGEDRVRISGVTGRPPPPTTKVALHYLGGYANKFELMLCGLDLEAKADWVKEQVEVAISGDRPAVVRWQLDRTDVEDPPTQAAAMSVLRCHVRDQDPENVGKAFSRATVELALGSIPGFAVTEMPAEAKPFGIYRPAHVPQDSLGHTVVHADGTRQEIDPPKLTEEPQTAAAPRLAPPPASRSMARVPLGRLAYARSGDKGGDANIGVWIPAGHPRRAEAYAWLAATMTPARVRELLPEAAGLDVEVQSLTNLAGVNIVIGGLLGDGVASSTRVDPQAKALAEWLRARYVEIPRELLP